MLPFQFWIVSNAWQNTNCVGRATVPVFIYAYECLHVWIIVLRKCLIDKKQQRTKKINHLQSVKSKAEIVSDGRWAEKNEYDGSEKKLEEKNTSPSLSGIRKNHRYIYSVKIISYWYWFFCILCSHLLFYMPRISVECIPKSIMKNPNLFVCLCVCV